MLSYPHEVFIGLNIKTFKLQHMEQISLCTSDVSSSASQILSFTLFSGSYILPPNSDIPSPGVLITFIFYYFSLGTRQAISILYW